MITHLFVTDLRDTIRSELRLESVKGNIWWFRFNRATRKERFRIGRTTVEIKRK